MWSVLGSSTLSGEGGYEIKAMVTIVLIHFGVLFLLFVVVFPSATHFLVCVRFLKVTHVPRLWSVAHGVCVPCLTC